MVYKARDLVKDVKVAIDQNRESGSLVSEGDIDTLSLDELIMSKVEEGARLVEMEAPVFMLESGHDFVRDGGRDVYIDSQGKGFVVLPKDFMRLVAFRMSDWERTVYEAIGPDSTEYKLQSSRWKGIYGSVQKPVVAIVRRNEGKVLEFYSCDSAEATAEQCSYVPYPKIDKTGGIDISEDCYRAAVYRIGGLVLASIGDQLSGTLIEISRSLLGQ